MELIKSNEELKSKPEEFSSSVEDVLIALVDKNCRLKVKLKAEQDTVDRLRYKVLMIACVRYLAIGQ